MGLRVNFTDVESSNFEALPAGWYTVKATEFSVETSGEQSKNPGAQYIKWTLTVTEGEFANRKIFNNTSLLPKALFALKGFMEALGLDTDGEVEFDPNDAIGMEVKVKVTQRPYNGDTVNDVKGFKSLNATTSASSLMP